MEKQTKKKLLSVLKVVSITSAVLSFLVLMAYLGSIDKDRYLEKMKEHQQWCTSQGGDFTRHGSGLGPDWSCTIRNGEGK